MSRSSIAGAFLLGTAAILFLFPAPAQADIGKDLGVLKSVVDARLAGGTLDRKQEKAAGRILQAIEKADVGLLRAKYLKKVAAVLKRTDQAIAKSVDLEDRDADLLDSLILAVTDHRAAAVRVRDVLFLEKSEKKIAGIVVKGDAKVTKAGAQLTNGKQAKSYGKAAGQFIKAEEKGLKLRQKEIDDGLVVFEVLSTSIDVSSTLAPGDLITVTFNLEVDPGRLQNPAAEILDAQGGQIPFGSLPSPSGDGTIMMLQADFPPGAADYTLKLHGQDSPIGDSLVSLDGVPLKLSVTRTFSVAP